MSEPTLTKRELDQIVPVLQAEYDKAVSAMMPVEGRWYWVRQFNGDWFPAMRCAEASGGWTNGDTWEDFHNEIIAWKLIDPPPS